MNYQELYDEWFYYFALDYGREPTEAEIERFWQKEIYLANTVPELEELFTYLYQEA